MSTARTRTAIFALVALASLAACDGNDREIPPDQPRRLTEPPPHPAPAAPCGVAGQAWQDIAVSPDGWLFALQARSGAIALHRLRDGAHVRALAAEGEAPAEVEFVRGGERLIFRRLGRGNVIQLWDVPDGRILRQLNGGWIKAFAPSGEEYVSGSYEGRSPAKLVRLSDERMVWEWPDGAQRVLFSPDGTRLVVQLELDRYAIWNVKTGEGIALSDRIRGTWMAVTPDVSLLGLLADGPDPQLTVWRVSDGTRFDLDVSEAARLTLSSARLRGFSPDGKLLVVRNGVQPASRAPWVAFWSTEQLGTPTVVERLADAAFLRDGRLLTVGTDGVVTLRAGGLDAAPLWQISCGP